MWRIVFAGLLFLFTGTCFSQQVEDSLAQAAFRDSLARATYIQDSLSAQRYYQTTFSSALLSDSAKVFISDVQQLTTRKSNLYVFLVLLVLLGSVAYVKTAFGKDMQEMLQSVWNRNLAMQIFRTQTSELSFSSFLLHLNFILVMSLYARFVLISWWDVTSLETFSAILLLIFLFTFFYLLKYAATYLIGVVFEVKQPCEEYIFNFSTLCKTLGLSLIPALFIFYTAPQKVSQIIFVFTFLLFIVFALLFLWRGLSTGYKLLYTSVYHFIIYVCIAEVVPLLLLIKLLTKTVS